MNTIYLEKKHEGVFPSFTEGKFAFIQAIIPSIGAFIAIECLATLTVFAFDDSATPVPFALASTVLVVAALFMASFVQSANARFTEDHAATGALNTGFWTLASKAKGEQVTLLHNLAWQMYYFLSDIACEIQKGKKILNGNQPILVELRNVIDTSSPGAANSIDLLAETRNIRAALGGIARRRAHPLLRSRYVATSIFAAAGIFFLALSGVTSLTNGYAIHLSAFVVTYGFATVLSYVRQMESGIGHDPSDVKPESLLNGWLAELSVSLEDK